MSCQIRLTANITDVGAIRRCLFPTDDLRGSDSWLQLCEMSVSPTGDIIAIANGRRLVILAARWDPSSSTSQFQVAYSGSVHESDNVKAVLCLPIVNQTKSSHVVPDWTCVLLGFESGFLRFYTENCELLLEEQLHNEVITSLKCQSQHNPRPDISPELHPEEIYVQYQSNICVVAGTQLFPVLRVWRSELARVQAKGESLEPFHGGSIPKKWGFQDQAVINDVTVVGVNLHGTFDHLLTASTCGGFETKYRSAAPYNNLVLAAGSRPFLGYHYAHEGGQQPVFSDVAKAVATKLKSALPGWLTGNKSPVEKQMTVAMQPPESMGCRFGLCDLRRTATGVILSTDHKLAAVSDALGRVILVDAFRGIALRVFKGYRDAQCSFVQVPDERHSKHRIGNKVALFLVIYSPKKGTLEIFTVQEGSRVATFSASKHSRLVYNSYGLVGFTTTSKSRFVCQFTTVLIDNDGQVKEVLIPFHFAVNEKNSRRARDIHLYKKLKQLLKYGEYDPDTLMAETGSVCAELKTPELKLQTLELLLGDSSVPAEVALRCVQCFLENPEDEDGLRTIAENAEQLLKLYQFVNRSTTRELDLENGNSDAGDKAAAPADTKLNLGAKQLSSLQKFLDLDTLNAGGLKVGFEDPKEFSAAQFVSVFDLRGPHSVALKPNVEPALLSQVSEAIFKKHVVGAGADLAGFEDQVVASRVATKDLFRLLLHYWVNHPLGGVDLVKEMNNLLNLLMVLVKPVARDEVVEYGATSEFWNEIRGFLANSSRPFPALTAAILCKIVSQTAELEMRMDDSSASLEEDSMEVLSQERVEWTLLIGKLEDVSLLNIILANKPVAKDCTLPKLRHDKVDLSLKYILEKGKGSVSELVAQWLTQCGVNPENIVINDLIQKKSLDNPEQLPTDRSVVDDDELPEQDIPPQKLEDIKSERVFEHLNLMKTQFPYSLEAGVILTNMCWEYALAWQKDIQDLGNLEACLKCLGAVPDPHVKEGLYNLVWNTHLKILFESTCKLINKVGRLPKERLCRQDTGLTDYQIALFLGVSTDFLDSYMDAVQQSYGLTKPTLRFEPIWEDGPQALVELALQQNPINYDLLHLHYQLSLTLQMITTFSIKHTKPVNNLFESYMVGMFFQDFQTQVHINWSYADGRVQASRTQFLFKVVSASLESVTVTDDRVYTVDHVRWMSRCLDLARLWNLDVDVFRRYQLIQVYTSGFDSFGDEILSLVEEQEKAGPEMLVVAGKRLAQFLSTSPDLGQNMGVLTTSVTRYIDGLNGDWCAPSTLQEIENLTIRSLSCLDKNRYEYKIGEMLLHGCQSLQTIYKRS